MHPLSIFLSLFICFTSVSMPLKSVAYDGGATVNTSHCKSVPYPFGAPGVAIPGFEVACTSTKRGSVQYPSLQLPTGAYLIQNISLQGQVRILTGPIYQQCYDYNNGIEILTRGTGWLDLTGTPFTLSKDDTTFIVIGCNDVAVINGDVGDGNGGGENFMSGCVAYCRNSSSRFNGSCSGLGCCQMPLPGPGGLKSFELNLYKVQNTGVNRLTNCSLAFFAMRDEFSFRTEVFDSSEYFRDSQANHVAVLNWVIGDESCEEAEKDVKSFGCKENSLCFDSPDGAGYLCNCRQGYEGNPYAEGGCTDIDECQHPEMNPCIRNCMNTEGSVTCGCPSGMTGDGRKDGSGCKKPFPLAFILAELLTREKPLFSSRKFEGGSLIAYFCSAMKENRLFEILDPQVVNEAHKTELEAVAKLAQMCLRMKGEERPTMKEVEVRLEVLWRSNRQQEHSWTSQSLEERQLMLPDYITGIDTTLQRRFEQELQSSSKFPSVNDIFSI